MELQRNTPTSRDTVSLNDFTTLCLTAERQIGLNSVAHVLVGLRKQFIDNFVFPTWAGAAGFNNNNNNNSLRSTA